MRRPDDFRGSQKDDEVGAGLEGTSRGVKVAGAPGISTVSWRSAASRRVASRKVVVDAEQWTLWRAGDDAESVVMTVVIYGPLAYAG